MEKLSESYWVYREFIDAKISYIAIRIEGKFHGAPAESVNRYTTTRYGSLFVMLVLSDKPTSTNLCHLKYMTQIFKTTVERPYFGQYLGSDSHNFLIEIK